MRIFAAGRGPVDQKSQRRARRPHQLTRHVYDGSSAAAFLVSLAGPLRGQARLDQRLEFGLRQLKL